MKLIDTAEAAAVIADYFDEICDTDVTFNESEILRRLNKKASEQPTVDAVPKWILCGERLPETKDEVLTTYIVNGNKKRRFVQTATWYDNEEEGFWSSPWDEYLVPNTKIEVLAWMPLPKPYEGKAE